MGQIAEAPAQLNASPSPLSLLYTHLYHHLHFYSANNIIMGIQAAFDKAVQIVKELPKDGPVKPSQDDQLAVSGHGCRPTRHVLMPVLRSLQAGQRG